MAGRYYGNSGLNSYSTPSSTFYFASNYVSSRTYYSSSPGVSANRKLYTGNGGLSSAYSSSPVRTTFDLPRPKPFGVKPVYHSPARVVKPSMPAISEGFKYKSRPTPPPMYRPLPPSSYLPPIARTRPDIRDTANIDVTQTPRSRLDYQAEEPPRKGSKEDELAIGIGKQRDISTGTLRRGRKVIRLTTTRLPNPETIASAPKEAAKPSAPTQRLQAIDQKQALDSALAVKTNQESSKPPAPPKQISNVTDERARLPPKPYVLDRSPVGTPPARKTPGEKLKEKYMIASRKGPKKPPTFGFQPQHTTSPGPVLPMKSFRSALSEAIAEVKSSKSADRQDSGLGSSPAVTTPTSLRNPKESSETRGSSNDQDQSN